MTCLPSSEYTKEWTNNTKGLSPYRHLSEVYTGYPRPVFNIMLRTLISQSSFRKFNHFFSDTGSAVVSYSAKSPASSLRWATRWNDFSGQTKNGGNFQSSSQVWILWNRKLVVTSLYKKIFILALALRLHFSVHASGRKHAESNQEIVHKAC